MGSATLDHVVVVLDHPKDLVNIAGVLRVMMNFGISRLRLVEPDEFDAYRIEGIAHRSGPLIERTTFHDTLADAVGDALWVVGTSARPRTAGRTYGRPREIATELVARARGISEQGATGSPTPPTVAIVFGREDRGLSNEELDLCHAVAIIPTDVEYSSLNLAQACLVMAYETFLASGGGDDAPLPKGRRATRPPSQAELEETFAALADGLARIQFYKARKPEAVLRTLRTLITRAEPDLREARLLAAIGYEIGNFLDRQRSGMPSDAGPRGNEPPRP